MDRNDIEKTVLKKERERKEELVKYIYGEFERRRRERKSLELQWRLNINFLAGNQYAEITPDGDISDFGKYYYWQEREIFNHIAPIIETRIAKLGRVKSGVSVRPFSNDKADVDTAKLSTQILRAITNENKLSELVGSATYWSELTGSAFYKIAWDKSKGRALAVSRDGAEIKEGDVRISVCPPYELFPDTVTAEGLSDLRSLMHVKAYPAEEIRDKWGVEVEGSEINVFSLEAANVAGGLGYTASVPNISRQTMQGYCAVIEYYEKPTKAHKNGRLVIAADNKILYEGELPYVNGSEGAREFPFARQAALEQVGNFFGVSLIERMIPVQRAYNAVKNRKHEFINRLTMGVLAVEDGSVDTDELAEEGLSPGKILVYRQGSSPPVMMNLGSVPAELTVEEERLLNEFLVLSGVSEFSKYGKVPSNVTSGVALSLLTEQDDTKISISAEHIRKAVMSVGEQILRLYKQFAAQMRVKRIAGDNGDIELKSFNASSLQCDDLVFDTENELSDTPSNRKNLVFELIRMGLLQDEDGRFSTSSRLKVLEMLGFGNWESGLEIDECHKKKAQRENSEPLKAADSFLEIDNHALHIDEHTKALVSAEGVKNEEEKLALLAHIALHKSLITE